MAGVRVRRRADSFGLLRRMVIEVDGTVAARLRPGQEETVAVGAGRHEVRARMDWTSSATVEVHVGDGDEVLLETSLPARAMIDMVVRPRSAIVLGRV